MDQDKIKEAFQKAKQDIDSLKSDIYYINQDIQEIKRTLQSILVQQTNQQTSQQTQKTHIPTPQHINRAQIPQNPTQNAFPTQEIPYKAVKEPFIPISTGNDGVPTNQPTNQQTNQHPLISHGNSLRNQSEIHIPTQETKNLSRKMSNFNKISHLEQVSNVLSTLDDIKKELRTKFKRLTNQEIAIFSAIYQLEEQGFIVDYSLISEKLGLSEISIRDYVHKLIKKDIPIQKFKESNRKISLSISQNLKKIAPLSTILALREL
jgi:hypothetical protein